MIKFITNNPICFISEEKTLVISDVHIGLEHDLYKSGIIIPAQVETFLKTLNFAIDFTKAKKLVILGDLKNQVPGTNIRELRQIPLFLERLLERVDVVLCKGNHDDNIEMILPNGVKLVGSEGFKIKKYGFFHGHAWPSKRLADCDYIFMGHLQPGVQFIDALGYRNVEQAWIKTKLDSKKIKEKYKTAKTGKLNLIILPAFNRLSGYFILNSNKELTGPLFNSDTVDMDNSDIYLLDSTHLGKMKDLARYG